MFGWAEGVTFDVTNGHEAGEREKRDDVTEHWPCRTLGASCLRVAGQQPPGEFNVPGFDTADRWIAFGVALPCARRGVVRIQRAGGGLRKQDVGV
jgi:hypothetical protein